MTEAGFPIIESFKDGHVTHPHWKLRGKAILTEGPNGALQLTSDSGDQAGTAYLNQPFSSKLGVSIEFDYACYGDSDNFGDGFSFYLIDGKETTEAGAYGAALGYSSMRVSHANVVPGVTAGYVGIGFDNYGNYASDLAGPNGPGRRPRTLGVRGSGSGRDGFRWLRGEEVPGGFQATWEKHAHVQINIINGLLTVRHFTDSDRGGTTLIKDFDLANAPGQVIMPDTFKLGLAASTGAARATHLIRNLHVALPAEMPLEMAGDPPQVEAGRQLTYTVKVRNDGPNAVPDAEVLGTIPTELSDRTLHCEPRGGATAGEGSTNNGLHQPLDLPVGSSAVITLAGTVDSDAGGSTLSCTTQIKSRTRANTAAKQSDTVNTEVKARRLVPVCGQVPASQETGTWQQGGDSGIVFVNVDTRHAGFKETPIYVAAMAGKQYVANLGAPGIYDRHPDGFRVGLRRNDQAELDVAQAERNGLRLHWMACPRNAAGIACGQTEPGAWRQGEDSRIVLVDVDTSNAGFTETPVFVASVAGEKYTANLSTVALYNQTSNGFTAAIRLIRQNNLDPQTAQDNGFRLNWIACARNAEGIVCGQSTIGTWRQGDDTGILFTDTNTSGAYLPDSPAFVTCPVGNSKVAELCNPGIYGGGRRGFTAGVRRSDKADLPPEFAKENNIAVNWIACPPRT
ncbi:hypothetical protein AQI88_35455 [Streptomyces cellostaticus]|uniref:DUF11 domain-containing protein n=1 Tax=Streptomyces cellostaticus TaxID=67285 RepID=A0A117PU20_9ACTN|nr:hypothetical protein AQI88_35455 [Streptomyces cellostaticus]